MNNLRTPEWLMTRRSFLAAVGALGLTAACSRNAASDLQAFTVTGGDGSIIGGVPQRIPFIITGPGADSWEDTRSVRVVVHPSNSDRDGKEVLGSETVPAHVVAHDHPRGTPAEHNHSGLLRYYPFRFTFPSAGIYDLAIETNSGSATLPVQVLSRSEVNKLNIGDEFPYLQTPTFAQPLGRDPICTRAEGPCPLHSADAALERGTALSLLVASPEQCSNSYCSPVLETLIETAPQFPRVTAIHLDPAATETGGPSSAQEGDAEVSDGYLSNGPGPILFAVNAQGRVVERLDGVFDAQELGMALTAIS